MKIISLLLIVCLATATLAQNRSPAEIFDGSYNFQYTTQQTAPGVRVTLNVGKIGNIGYWPAYHGALYGNMSVTFGTPDLPTSTTCDFVMSDFASYTGSYTVFPQGDGDGRGPFVQHLPILNSNPINGHTPAGIPSNRYYVMTGNDVNMELFNYDANNGTLMWQRNFPYPPPGAKQVTATLTSRTGSSWVANGVEFGVYDLIVVNTGAVPVSAATVDISFGPGVSVTSSWGLSRLGTSNSYIAQLYGLLAGATSSSNGLILEGPAGFTTPSIGVNQASLA